MEWNSHVIISVYEYVVYQKHTIFGCVNRQNDFEYVKGYTI